MEQNTSWDDNSHSANQEIPHLLRNPKSYYRVHKSPPLVPILSQMYPFCSFPPSFPKIHSNNNFWPMSSSFEWSLPFRFSDENIICISHLSYEFYMPRPSHYPWFDYPNNIWWSVDFMKLLTVQSPKPLATSSLLGKNIPLRMPFSNSLSVRVCSSISVRAKLHNNR